MFVSKLVLFFAATVCVSSSVQDADLTLTLFYEGLCPGCHQFILNQLYPSYEKLAGSLKLDLVPYGWSHSHRSADGKVTFTCQHGDEECYINRIHACVLDQNPSSLDYVTFIYKHLSATEERRRNEQEELELAKQLVPSSVSWDKVNDCYHGERGTELLLSSEERQSKLNPALPWVPNLRFNGVYDKAIEEEATIDFTSTVCKLLKDNKPDVCKDYVRNAHPKMIKSIKC
ncbi:gamma-interferon-inducible lysosomal thiol reductase isoform X5 [Diabrotica virgifera virgifera]|uniref:Gamma-interferon-inducible lysosomal thiol reductase-like n=1 Tax=Diabrotica virgifera virgifera TaxID=50390 RepID=A0ABM5KDZ9_DIAVI|nr:gamma-interferon-inducible lysosomal thiol reductase isoform X5 [Diabrotica virgifera virgifera]